MWANEKLMGDSRHCPSVLRGGYEEVTILLLALPVCFSQGPSSSLRLPCFTLQYLLDRLEQFTEFKRLA
jgi:hypothetical protein